MPSYETIYDTSRVLGTITAGIFTGLAASAPLYTLPSLLNHVNKAAASSLNLAGISGAAFLVAAYAAPKEVAYNPKFLGRGASEIGQGSQATECLFSRLTTSRGLLLYAGAGLILLIPFSTLIVGPITKSTINMRTKLQAEQIAGTGAGVPNKGQDEFNKQLKKWSIATEVVALLGLVATVSEVFSLSELDYETY
ncbi:hypothetical protein RHS01_00458 [Rhizoctonia solani]|uniref:Uncharacterized protein n=1 Tax=Rhizoctonia solani TaxID=456999 RepID=A0A8H7ILZ8_9AGAM|nr:hypothetical protein RHS01_00458 [Rhizoctonia solani]